MSNIKFSFYEETNFFLFYNLMLRNSLSVIGEKHTNLLHDRMASAQRQVDVSYWYCICTVTIDCYPSRVEVVERLFTTRKGS